jgi:cytochrome b6-f complex iron-sulfur subunit
MMRFSRRDFLKLATDLLFSLAGLLGLGGLLRFFSYQPDPTPPSEFDLGEASAYPPGSRTLLPDVPAVLYNEHGNYTALSLTCTHLGCTVEADEEDGFSCPCHGSRYNRDGLVLQGPAQKPLRALRVELQEDDTIRLFTN